ncbi:hypothetical protein AALA00_14160 [Lachnospiraceae bacterium 46-15]
MKALDIKKYLDEVFSHFLFEYNGENCGVDPISRTHFDMWYGDKEMTAESIDEVMEVPFFDGLSLTEIAKNIEM